MEILLILAPLLFFNHANPVVSIPDSILPRSVSNHYTKETTDCLERHNLKNQDYGTLNDGQKQKKFVCESYQFWKTLKDGKDDLKDGFPYRDQCKDKSGWEDYGHCIIEKHGFHFKKFSRE